MEPIKNTASAKEKGSRLRRLRRAANLERRDLANKYDINYETLKGWENGKHGGLTKKRAEFFTEVFKNDGVECAVEWLMYGIGDGPRLVYKNKTTTEADLDPIIKLPHLNLSEQTQIEQELSFFCEKNKPAFYAIVTDHLMEPSFQKGDIVAGIKLFDVDMKKAIRCCCLFQTADGEIKLRYLKEITKKEDYVFIGLNIQLNSDSAKIIVPQTDLVTIAPVLWHRHPHMY
ncbi:MAG: hypothetical protein A2X77_03940 [Gammaproteobacteria bacterium GWE2_42_36]|nr:MAG: hypothetical protein A2X77_03940 [Gammaproteobacteria bacterium GWE2_42_36]HCU04982.1 hypothetical protein [Coxiellaceae bacterium]